MRPDYHNDDAAVAQRVAEIRAAKVIAPPPADTPAPCRHRGDDITGPERQSAGLSHAKQWLRCDHPRRVSLGIAEAVCPCMGCGPSCIGYETDGTTRLPLAHHFNASLIEWRGRLILASRKGRAGSRLYLTDLRPDLTPVATTEVVLDHPRCRGGREDPRLFVHGDRLHLAFIGVEVTGGVTQTHQLVAELDDQRRAVNVWCPTYAARQWPKEKNWVFFEGESGELLSVYSIEPHLVLAHRGTAAVEVARTSSGFRWPWGQPRGGASPVRVGGEWYHWFHGTGHRHGGPYYTGGLYTFSPEPPYRVLRYGPEPLLVGDRANDEGKRVVFPCGAVLRNGKWLVSYGWNDVEVRTAEFDAGEIERRLVSA